MKTSTRAASLILAILAAGSCTLLSSCGVSKDAKSHKYENFSLKDHLGVSFPTDDFEFGQLSTGFSSSAGSKIPNIISTDPHIFPMTVYDKMDIYESAASKYPKNTLFAGTSILLREPTGGSEWAEVFDTSGVSLGYTKDGFMHALTSGTEFYAELPVEIGTAPDSSGRLVNAYSHLVDVRKYFKVYSSTNKSNSGVDITQYDIKVSMQLSTEETSINEPFYNSNLCLLQYDTIQKLMKAVELFKKDGYTVVIYDAYRPTSVQQRWFDVVRVHKWVADPSRGMGGIHDRGTAIDMSLIDAEGNELEMPTPMHTFSVDSARNSEKMSETARANMEYMTNIMAQCGFSYINSEWWHFQCVNTKNYLPTDHPIDEIPLIPSEKRAEPSAEDEAVSADPS